MSLIKAKEAREKRGKAVKAMRDLQANHADNWTDEVQGQWTAAEADEKRYLAEAERFEKMAKLDSEEGEQRAIVKDQGGDLDRQKEEGEKRKKDYGTAFEKYIKQSRSNRLSDQEHKILVSGESRAQTVGTNTQGGYLMPEGFSNEIDKQMKFFGGMMEVSRNLRTNTGNPIPWPTVDDTSNVGAIITETTGDSEQDLVFGSKQLDAYTYTSKLVLVSWELLQDSYFNIQTLLAEMLGERLGRAINNHLTVGTGSSQPNGIVTASSLGITAAAAAAISRPDIVKLIHSVNSSYRKSKNARLMFTDQTLSSLKQITIGASDARPLWQPSMIVGQPDKIEGHQYVINDDMADIATGQKTMLFGDMSKYINRTVKDIELVVATERYVEKRSTGFFAYMRADGELINTSAVKHLIQA